MALNTTGFLLEGMRVATANSPYTFPARTLVTDQGAIDASPGRAEYAVFVSGQDPALPGIEIADPNLRFLWTRNNGTVIRFDWDGFAKRWSTSPGSGQEKVGKCANSPRIVVPVPDKTVSTFEAPYAIYAGSPDRTVTFNVSVIGSSEDFGDPPAGTVEVSSDKGELNFGTADLGNQVFANQPVYLARQSFFDRTKNKGRVGLLPSSSAGSYGLWLNPIPGSGQAPRVRIGFRQHLVGIPVATEAALHPLPAAGFFKFSLDTGKLAFSAADIDAYAEMPVYYDGVLMGSFQLHRGIVGVPASSWPAAVGTKTEFVGATDSSRFVIFNEAPGKPRYYFQVQLADSDTVSSGPPADGSCYINPDTGSLYVSGSDPGAQTGAVIQFVDGVHELENGVSVQLYKSGLNVSGEEVTPDFVDTYSVLSQVIADGIGSSPFVQLPTVPTVDSFLEYKVDQGTSGGTFTGNLVDANDPTKPGNGYILDLEAKQLKFSSRKTVLKVLDKATSAFKLDDSVVNPYGFETTRNGVEIRPGVDFDFNQDVGLVEFIEPVGENDPANSVGFSGSAGSSIKWDAAPGSFPATSQEGKYLFVKDGPNFGIYPILASSGTTTLFISGAFPAVHAAGTADIRNTLEVVADRFWTPFLPPFKKLKVYRAASVAGPFGLLGTSEFTILASTGQINLTVAAKPTEVFKVEYIWLQSPDDGVTVTPTPVTEFAGFKIRQEIGTVVPNSGVVHFNPDGKTVLTAYPITLYVDGITVPPENLVFTAPGTITVSQLLLDTTTVTINYFVAESPGGNTFFTLVNSPVDVDFPLVTDGEAVTVYNGDQTSIVSPGSAMLINDKEVVLVGGVVYDPAADTTTITFNPEPTVNSEGAPLKVCAPVSGSYLVSETNPVDVLTKGTNTLSVGGNVVYPAGTIVFVDNDPYYVVSSSYVVSSNRTNVILAVNAHRNYILPDLKRTVRPVYNSTAEFKTLKPLHAGYPLTLVRTGTVNKTLKQGVDYDTGEGGVIKMTTNLAFGDTVRGFYVARKEQPVGTSFSFNYAFQIAPTQTNGIKGQKLIAKYRLKNPDTFFYRVESIKTFIPEVVKELASSSSGSSGPSTSSASSLQTKDYGSASLYFDEQHLRNLDVVISRLLKFYNDQANYYEDMLADFDGRVVGGSSGRMRFNGDVSGVKRNSYAEVQNDIDDQVKLYDGVVLVSFSPLTFADGPVYGPIWDYNNLSRFYGTTRTSVPVAFNGKFTPILNYGSTVGSIGISNLTSVSTFVTARARSEYVSVSPDKKTLSLAGPNGDAKNLVPAFVAGMKVSFYGPDGVKQGSTTVSSAGSDQIVLADAVTSLIGSVMAENSDTTAPGVNGYNGDYITVDQDNGQVHNSQFPPPFGPTSTRSGNEIVEVNVTFVNKDVTPKRIPALDGLELTDGGALSFPPLAYQSELNTLALELYANNHVGTGVVSALNTVSSCLVPVDVGQVVLFLNGLNAGQQRTVATVGPAVSTFTVNPPFALLDAVPRDLYVVTHVGSIPSLTSQENGLVASNTAVAPVDPAIIGRLDSELKALDKAILSYGPVLVNRAGGSTTAADELTDAGGNFLGLPVPVTNSCFVYVPSGSNYGLYKVKEVHSTHLKLDTAAPFAPFPGVGALAVQYYVVQPWQFVTPKQPAFATEFIRSALAWTAATSAWGASPTLAGLPGRQAAVNARILAVKDYVSKVQSLLKKDEKIYDTRYLWIKQRIDRKEGLVVKIGQAAAKRQETLDKLISDQQKKLISSQIA
jgi:hypothetical protein